jgi:molybdate transport system substrate-binding protein
VDKFGVKYQERPMAIGLARIAGILAAAFLCASACADVTISAAISLKPALEKAQPLLEQAAGEKISFNFGASGTLAGQIQQGAPVDLFISADRPTVQKLLDAHAADPASVKTIAGNELVLIATRLSSAPKPAGFSDVAKLKKIAIGDPKVVPAGAYAQETLTALKLYDQLDKAGQLVTAENVAQVVTFVQRGDVDAGIVYATDAQAATGIQIVATADPTTHSRIEYVSVLVVGSAHHEAAAKAQQTLLADKVQAILHALGFTPPPALTTTTKP